MASIPELVARLRFEAGEVFVSLTERVLTPPAPLTPAVEVAAPAAESTSDISDPEGTSAAAAAAPSPGEEALAAGYPCAPRQKQNYTIIGHSDEDELDLNEEAH